MVHLASVMPDPGVFHENNSSWLPNVQLMTERLSNGLFVAAHGGNNGESHNHNDVGDFIIYANSDPVIIDVGSGTYTAKTFSKDRYKIWFNTSAYHNLPVLNGVQQSDGLNFAARNVVYKKDNNAAMLEMDIAPAYSAGAGLGTWKRTITAGKETIIINDNFQTKAAVAVTQTFMTVCEADISIPGLITFTTADGKKISLQYEKEWQVTKELVPLITEEDQGLKATWRNQPITRILLTLKSSASRGNHQYTIASEN
jgi:hypothetical protein